MRRRPLCAALAVVAGCGLALASSELGSARPARPTHRLAARTAVDFTATAKHHWFDFGTRAEAPLAPPWMRNAAAMAVAPDGSLLIADTGNHRVMRVSASWRLLDLWGTRGSDEAQFESPRGVAVLADGSVAVSDSGNGRIQIFDEDGGFRWAWGSRGNGPHDLLDAGGIAVDGDGTLWVADTGHHRIQHYTSSGEHLGFVDLNADPAGRLSNPNDVAILPNGLLAIADTGNDRVLQAAPDGGAPAEVLSSRAALERPTDVSTSGGSVWVLARGTVTELRAGGEVGARFRAAFGDEAPGLECCLSDESAALAVTPSGTVFFATQSRLGRRQPPYTQATGQPPPRGLGRSLAFAIGADGSVVLTDPNFEEVQRYSTSGRWLSSRAIEPAGGAKAFRPMDIAALPGGGFAIADAAGARVVLIDAALTPVGHRTHPALVVPGGLAIEADGAMVVADLASQHVVRIEADGDAGVVWGRGGSGPGEFAFPSALDPTERVGLDVLADGAVVVSDQGNRRVQRFDASGRFLGAFPAPGDVTELRDIVELPDNSLLLAGSSGLPPRSGPVRGIARVSAEGTVLPPLWGGCLPRWPQGCSAADPLGDAPGIVAASKLPGGSAAVVGRAGSAWMRSFSREGVLVSTWSLGGEGDARVPYAHMLWAAMATKTDGSLMIAESLAHSIARFSPLGVFQGRTTGGTAVGGHPAPTGSAVHLSGYAGLDVDDAGRVFVVDGFSEFTSILEPDDKTLDWIRVHGHGGSSVVAAAADGSVYLDDARAAGYAVTHYSREGRLVDELPPETSGLRDRPLFEVAPDGSVVMAGVFTTTTGGVEAQGRRYAPDWALLAAWPYAGGDFAVAPDGSLYEAAGGDIVHRALDGAVIDRFSAGGWAAGIAMGGDGLLRVATGEGEGVYEIRVFGPSPFDGWIVTAFGNAGLASAPVGRWIQPGGLRWTSDEPGASSMRAARSVDLARGRHRIVASGQGSFRLWMGNRLLMESRGAADFSQSVEINVPVARRQDFVLVSQSIQSGARLEMEISQLRPRDELLLPHLRQGRRD